MTSHEFAVTFREYVLRGTAPVHRLPEDLNFTGWSRVGASVHLGDGLIDNAGQRFLLGANQNPICSEEANDVRSCPVRCFPRLNPFQRHRDNEPVPEMGRAVPFGWLPVPVGQHACVFDLCTSYATGRREFPERDSGFGEGSCLVGPDDQVFHHPLLDPVHDAELRKQIRAWCRGEREFPIEVYERLPYLRDLIGAPDEVARKRIAFKSTNAIPVPLP